MQSSENPPQKQRRKSSVQFRPDSNPTPQISRGTSAKKAPVKQRRYSVHTCVSKDISKDADVEVSMETIDLLQRSQNLNKMMASYKSQKSHSSVCEEDEDEEENVFE